MQAELPGGIQHQQTIALAQGGRPNKARTLLQPGGRDKSLAARIGRFRRLDNGALAVNHLAVAGETDERLIRLDHEGGDHVVMRLEAEALFVLVGRRPAQLPFPPGRLPRGFFVAGDAEGEVYRQVAIASGSGMRAAMRCIEFLEDRA